jgi:hypothetical protein
MAQIIKEIKSFLRGSSGEQPEQRPNAHMAAVTPKILSDIFLFLKIIAETTC